MPDELATKVDPAKRRQGKKIGSFLNRGDPTHPLLLGSMSFRGSGGPPPDEIVSSSVSDQPAAEVIVSTPLSKDESTALTTVTRATRVEAIPTVSRVDDSEDLVAEVSSVNHQQAIATV